MLSRISLWNTDGLTNQSVDIHLADGVNQGFIFKGATGLGPVDAAVSYNNYATASGGFLTGVSKNVRNIVLDIGFAPNRANFETVQLLRRALYVVASSGKNIRIDLFEGSTRVMWIRAEVEAVEPTMFEKDPGVQISAIAMTPWWNGPSLLTATGQAGQTINIDTTSDELVGIDVSMRALRNIEYIELRDLAMDTRFRVRRGMSPDQVCRIRTTDRYRRVELYSPSGALVTRLMDRLTDDSVWPYLRYGRNQLRAHPYWTNTPSIDVNIQYREAFSGY